MIVDAHVHAFPDALARTAIPALEAEGGTSATFDGTVGGLLGELDGAGVDVAVVASVATKPSQVRVINDWAARIASSRILPLGAMHPDFPDPAEEIARIAALGLRGIKLHPEYQRFAPDEGRMDPIYQAAIDHGLTILFHAGMDIATPTLSGTPEAFARMLDRTPGLTAILAHMGGFKLWDSVRRLLVGRDVFFDTSYTLGHLPDGEFVALLRAHGAERVLFGSDAPWTGLAGELGRLRGLPLSAEERDAVCGGNAARLFGLA